MREPELLPHLPPILDLFFLLAPSRPIGMGCVGAIPTADIIALAPESGLTPREFLHLCRALDAIYIARLNQKAQT